MKFLQTKYAIGLDISQSTVKSVLLEKNGNRISCIGKDFFDCREEGIIDDQEIFREIRSRLLNRDWLKHAITANIPQYLATIQVTDFPPQGNRSLEEMVSYESAQLAGMSEEEFVVDFQRMPAVKGLNNPVVIGLCKESVVRQRSLNLLNKSLKLSDMAMEGTALAGAYFNLYPEETESESPCLLIDIGSETSTVAIICESTLIHATSLFCGTDRFIQALATEKGIPVEEAAQHQHENTPEAHKAARVFETELLSTLEQWHEEELSRITGQQFAKVMLCGDGAVIPALKDFFAQSFDCPVKMIGTLPRQKNEVEPEFVVSFGLALQGLKSSSLDISLAPAFVKQENHRRKRFGFLVAALILFILFLTSTVFRSTTSLQEEHSSLNQRLEYLERVGELMPEIEGLEEEIHKTSREIFPLTEKGRRGQLITKTIRELGKARHKITVPGLGHEKDLQEDILTVYLGDRATFQAKKDNISPLQGDGEQETGSHIPLLFPSRFSDNTLTDSDNKEGVVNERDIDDIAVWESLVCGMLVRSTTERRYTQIRRLINHLQESDTFSNVDLMPGPEWTGREDIFRPWLDITEGGILEGYQRVHLRIPVLPPAEESP